MLCDVEPKAHLLRICSKPIFQSKGVSTVRFYSILADGDGKLSLTRKLLISTGKSRTMPKATRKATPWPGLLADEGTGMF